MSRIWSLLGPRTVVVALVSCLVVIVGGVLAITTKSFEWLVLAAVVACGLVLVVTIIKVSGLSAELRAIAARQPSDVVSAEAFDHARRPGQPLDLLRVDLVRDVSAIAALGRMLPDTGIFPAPGGWAATPETIATLVEHVLRIGPSTLVECGSGTSTVWLAAALKESGGGRVISLEHDERYLESTRQWLVETGLTEFVDLRLAPLRELKLDGAVFQWYDLEYLADIEDVSLIFVDGPPGSSAVRARYPAFPMLRTALTSGAVVVLDDIDREEEREILGLWRGLASSHGGLVDDRWSDRAAFAIYSPAHDRVE